jgi:hypothetical protein
MVPATVKKKPPIRLLLIARRQCGNMPADRGQDEQAAPDGAKIAQWETRKYSPFGQRPLSDPGTAAEPGDDRDRA